MSHSPAPTANPSPGSSPDSSVALTHARALIQCPSVTPIEGGALEYIAAWAERLGGWSERVDRNGTPNLFVKFGSRGASNGRHFAFAGHTDVVPVGDEAAWTHPPFAADVVDGVLYGRGAVDMKSGVACFMDAVEQVLSQRAEGDAISLIITGDEEGPATDGTRALLDWMAEQGERPDVCIVGEPTNPNAMGDAIKIGRRGSVTAYFESRGTQGHAAYPHLADNPVHPLLSVLSALTAQPLDGGTDHFQASSAQVVTIDVGNSADNVIPAKATATMNIRFNDQHSSESLQAWIDAAVAPYAANVSYRYRISGESFIYPPEAFGAMIADVVEEHTGRRPEYSTAGGTSDARFIKDLCPVAEFGLVGQTMHKVDERVNTADLDTLAAIYASLLQRYFAG
ncbi:MAG: succinyl-diaminopimelate desuccinylase [Alphaproteobacteria bacterium TMED89]|nr:succinyl-diaminopimelate desuccinylase [Rhodospirillaceae bacterium]RPH12527.1 MAG: succinyl-diaminopimelate desuccinylase [Alphaproteobacteria bacterium TMED89]